MYTCLGHVGPIEPVIGPIRPDKALLAGEVERQPLETLLRELFSLWTQSVLVSAAVIGGDGPAGVDLSSCLPGVGTFNKYSYQGHWTALMMRSQDSNRLTESSLV